jgi:ABC-type multidrug transport system fused ATPase/permease subunit
MKLSRGRFIHAVFWRTLFVILPMQAPVLTGAIIDGVNGREARLYGLVELPTEPGRLLVVAVAGLLAIALGYGVAAYLRATATARLSRQFVANLRKAMFEKIETLSLETHGRFGAGELLNRVILDTQSMRQFVEGGFARAFTNLAQTAYPLATLIVIDPQLTLIALSILPLQWLVGRWLQSRLHGALREARATQSQLTAAVKESLDGVETVHTLNAGSEFTRRLVAQAERLEADELRSNRYTAMISASVWMLTSVGYALVWWQGGMRVLEGRMTLGTLVVFTSFVAFLYTPFRRFTGVVNVYRKGLVALERIQEVLSLPSAVAEASEAEPLRAREWKVELRDAGFHYAGRRVLEEVNLEIPPRQLTAVMGRSGSGKTTLLGLIARLYDPSEGCVLIDGQDVRRVSLSSLRSQIAVVPQRPFIFNGTVAENIRVARPEASDAEIEQACRDAGAWEFINRMDDGMETRIGSGGVSLSGGEAQRIAIARALLRRPKLLLLDEPTSALDAEAEAAIVATLKRLKSQMTIVLVGHHLRAMSEADRIVVIERGRVIANRALIESAETKSEKGLAMEVYA